LVALEDPNGAPTPRSMNTSRLRKCGPKFKRDPMEVSLNIRVRLTLLSTSKKVSALFGIQFRRQTKAPVKVGIVIAHCFTSRTPVSLWTPRVRTP
jgi:hypothetical protein